MRRVTSEVQEEKIKAIERVDEMLGIIMKGFEGIIAVLPDHPTPVRVKTHTRDPVPFAVLGKLHDSCRCYSEREAKSGGYGVMNAGDFLPMLIS